VLRARLRGHLKRTEYFQQLEQTRRTLNRYLSRRTLEVVEAASKTGVPLPPCEREMSILFSDLRGFTELSGGIEPGRLFDLVSSLLACQVDIVHAHGGYVDKFGGGGVMAIFDGPGMIVQSLCAIEVAFHPRGIVPTSWNSGIGVHTGRAIIGNIGSPEHLDYSVIGTAVNVAARLCGNAGPAAIVVSEQVRAGAADDPRLCFHSERRIAIKGVKEPVTVYTLSSPFPSP
jgi:adenylate cyclase